MKTTLKCAAGAAAVALLGGVASSAPAGAMTQRSEAAVKVPASVGSKAVSNCNSWLASGTKAGATCRSGSGKWTLVVTCALWPTNTAIGHGPGTIYATCPPWSHVTGRSVVIYG